MENRYIVLVAFGMLSEVVFHVSARPFECGCKEGFGFPAFGGFPPIQGGPGCGIPLAPPVSFLPVPQPVPIRVPAPRPQSVTIPNIIVALLPPNQNKPIGAPRPIPVGPPPVVVPVPQPRPFLVPSPCEGAFSPCC